MFIIVRTIDFNSRTISLEIESRPSSEQFGRLREYLSYCGNLGFSKVKIYHPRTLSADEVRLLKKLKKECKISRVTLGSSKNLGVRSLKSENIHYRCSTPQVSRNAPSDSVEYSVHFLDFYRAVDHVTQFVSLIGNSIPLKDSTLSSLRLCIYELTVNTIEHANMTQPVPKAGIHLLISNGSVEVTYKDNADGFQTIGRKNVDLGQKIKTKSKRGLGLFVLAKVASDLRYERDGEWNCTKFKLKC